jgi:hypothetical protein
LIGVQTQHLPLSLSVVGKNSAARAPFLGLYIQMERAKALSGDGNKIFHPARNNDFPSSLLKLPAFIPTHKEELLKAQYNHNRLNSFCHAVRFFSFSQTQKIHSNKISFILFWSSENIKIVTICFDWG